VSKILAAKPDPFMNTGQCLFLPGVLRPVLGLFSRILQLLRSFEIGLIASEKAWVLDFFTVRGRQERLKPHIHADYLWRRWQTFRLDLDREGDIPLIGVRTFQADGLDLAFDPSMPNDLDPPNLGDDQIVTSDLDPVAVLRVGDATVAVELLIARVAGFFFTRFYAAKEGLKRKIEPDGDILQYLAVNELERRAGLFPAGKEVDHVVAIALEAVFVGKLVRLKHLVVDPATFFQHGIENTPLAVREVDAVFIGLAHRFIIVQGCINSKFVRLWAKAAKADEALTQSSSARWP
jgi:hypothetical protein